MVWIIREIITGLHIFLAIIWVGGIFFIGLGVYPAVRTLKFTEQQQFLNSIMKRSHWLFTSAGAGVIITGIILGTALGPIRNWHVLWETSYGNIWFAALIISLITLYWGVFIGYKRAMKVLSNDTLWQLAEKGYKTPLNYALITTAIIESVEVAGFIILIGCMVLLG